MTAENTPQPTAPDTIGQEGWEEVADYALEWATEHAATRPTG